MPHREFLLEAPQAIIRSRVQTSYRDHMIVTEASTSDGAAWSVRVTVLRDDAEGKTWVVKKLAPGGSVTFRTSTGAARAGMLWGRAWVERRERRELPMTLVIVDRARRELVKEFANRFAGDPDVRIICDRRIRLGESPLVDERRWDAEGLSAILSNKGYVIVRTE
jgi:hypothetical protein